MTKELPPLVPGTLYLVATPIGNREDITLRALRVLRECDIIAAEDTRHTANLLQSYEIKKPLLSYFKFNEAKRSEEIIQRLARGEKVALVTDAGTPGISDPGQRVVRAALQAGLKVESIPGPCAFVSALTASGLSTDEIHFIGFLPQKSAARRRRLESLKNLDATIALYESPYRIEKLLTELADIFPDRQIVLARELTKKFEQYLRGTAAELAAHFKNRTPKGEFVVLIEACRGRREESSDTSTEPEPNDTTPNPNTDEPANDLAGDDVRSPLPETQHSKLSTQNLNPHPITTVGALIFGPHDKVLMIQTHKWSNLWGIPGGKPKLGETSEDALRREIKEETNLDITHIQFILAQDCIHSPEFYRPAHFVLLNYTCRTEQTEVTLNHEAEHYRWLSIQDALQLPLNTPTKILLDKILAAQP
ncbi:MAG TPA: 16S rRNA (cytidine(1402)-2'-O)-methyltransferase [Verrucomicrobiae bacterium]